MTLAALHPSAVRSLVLDSVYPPGPVPLWSVTVEEAREAFFASCACDEGCATSFPDFGATHRAAPAWLLQIPLMASQFDSCGARIATDFIDDPQRPSDLSCSDRTA